MLRFRRAHFFRSLLWTRPPAPAAAPRAHPNRNRARRESRAGACWWLTWPVCGAESALGIDDDLLSEERYETIRVCSSISGCNKYRG